jgi:hypothetical protein
MKLGTFFLTASRQRRGSFFIYTVAVRQRRGSFSYLYCRGAAAASFRPRWTSLLQIPSFQRIQVRNCVLAFF